MKINVLISNHGFNFILIVVLVTSSCEFRDIIDDQNCLISPNSGQTFNINTDCGQLVYFGVNFTQGDQILYNISNCVTISDDIGFIDPRESALFTMDISGSSSDETKILLDLSDSITGSVLDQLKAEIKRFIETYSGKNSCHWFDGGKNIHEIYKVTDSIKTKIENIDKIGKSPDSSTNLYGSIIKILKTFNGDCKGIHNLVIYTDGHDQSNYFIPSDVTSEVREKLFVNIYPVALSSADTTFLTEIATDPNFLNLNAEDVSLALNSLLNQLIDQSKGTLFVGFCSPRRSGEINFLVNYNSYSARGVYDSSGFSGTVDDCSKCLKDNLEAFQRVVISGARSITTNYILTFGLIINFYTQIFQ